MSRLAPRAPKPKPDEQPSPAPQRTERPQLDLITPTPV